MTLHCCDMMRWNVEQACDLHPNRADCPDCLIEFWPDSGTYGILVHDGGSSIVEISFCPWCGKRLSDPVRHAGPTLVGVDCDTITDWNSFHDAFAAAFGFPQFYGRNLDAWVDCMSRLDEEFSDVRVQPGGTLILQLENALSLKHRRPDILQSVLELSTFVNWRRTVAGEPALLCVCANI